jgi:hypothetical protein
LRAALFARSNSLLLMRRCDGIIMEDFCPAIAPFDDRDER